MSLHAQSVTSAEIEQPVDGENNGADEKTETDHFFYYHQTLLQPRALIVFYADTASVWYSGYFSEIILPPPEALS
ncbi:MAG: hypothetical protein R3D00_04585 [Bacteroidia bacterium]